MKTYRVVLTSGVTLDIEAETAKPGIGCVNFLTGDGLVASVKSNQYSFVGEVGTFVEGPSEAERASERAKRMNELSVDELRRLAALADSAESDLTAGFNLTSEAPAPS
jgi:hypothetical protein